MKLNVLGANIRILRVRGQIPMSDKCRKTDIKPQKSPLDRIRERESTGLAFQQVKKVEPQECGPVYQRATKSIRAAAIADGVDVIDVPVVRRQKRGTSMLIQLAQLLDNEIHQHVRNGGKLGPIERQALILVQEVMRS